MKKTLGLIIVIMGILLISYSANAIIVTDGLISWWQFDEGSGSTAEDSWGSNDGTLYGNTVWTTDTAGPGSSSALGLDGNGDYVGVPHSALLNFGDGASFSIEQWVKTTQTNFGVTVSKLSWTSMYIPGYEAGINNGSPRIELQDGTGNYVGRYDAETPVNDGDWHQIVFVRDGDTDIYIYVDGVKRNTASAGISLSTLGNCSNTRSFSIGRDLTVDAVSYFLNGLIDDVRIYNRALTLGEIQQNYETYEPAVIPEPSVLLLFGTGLSGLLIFAGGHKFRRG